MPSVFSAPGMPTTCSDATITFPGFRLDDLCYGAKQTCAMCGVQRLNTQILASLASAVFIITFQFCIRLFIGRYSMDLSTSNN